MKRSLARLPMLVMALAISPAAWAQTTVQAKDLAYRSNGALRAPGAWRLDDNGFAGTFIQIPGTNPALVTITVAASKSSADPGTPRMRLRVADSNRTWDVTAIGGSYANHSQTWTLPPGTHAVRVEFINQAASLQLNLASLTVTGASVLNTASDANALAAAETYIAHYRRGPVTVTLTGANGRPLADTSVRLKLKRHAFNFGTAVSGISTADGTWISGTSANDANYRNFLNANFTSIEPENAGKWQFNEATRDAPTMDYVDQLRSYAIANGKRLRMHTVLWQDSAPAWVDALIATATDSNATAEQRTAAAASLRQAISSRIQYYLGQNNRALDYSELDGLNESFHRDIYTQIFGLAGVADIYNEIQQALDSVGSSSRNFVNEWNVLQWGDDPYASWYARHVEALRAAGAVNSVTGIGVQYYVNLDAAWDNDANYRHSASRIMQVFHTLSAESAALSLTEYGVWSCSPYNGPKIANAMAETVRLMFGHDQVNTFNLWGFWQPRMWPQISGGALVNEDWSLTDAGKAWQQMMGVADWGLTGVPVWTTDVTVTTDAQGKASFTGFYGDYTASKDDWQWRQDFTVTKGAANDITLAPVRLVAQLGDLFPTNSALAGAKAWPGNNGLNTNADGGTYAPNAINLAGTVPTAGSWRVGWAETSEWSASGWGNPTTNPRTMGGWIWPNDPNPQPATTPGDAQGYSWGGTHDVGWADHVGSETVNNIMNVRFNGGSLPLLQWTAAQAGTFNVSFTVGNAWSNWPGDFIGFGVWSTASNSYVHDNATMAGYAPNSTMIGTSPNPSASYTVTAANVTLAAGQSLWFVARVGGGTTEAGYQFQGATVSEIPLASGYDIWATTTHSLANPAFDFDSEGDSVDNGLEWILGGDPNASDTASILPTVTGNAASGLTLVFDRNTASISETTLTVEWDTDLDAFAHSVTVGAADSGPLPVMGVTVDVDAPSAGKVTVNIPTLNAPGGKLFARLKAVRN